MFGNKARHDEIVEELKYTKACCDELAREVYDLKECIQSFDVPRIIQTMESFIDATTYIQQIIESAHIGFEDKEDCCKTGE